MVELAVPVNFSTSPLPFIASRLSFYGQNFALNFLHSFSVHGDTEGSGAFQYLRKHVISARRIRRDSTNRSHLSRGKSMSSCLWWFQKNHAIWRKRTLNMLIWKILISRKRNQLWLFKIIYYRKTYSKFQRFSI